MPSNNLIISGQKVPLPPAVLAAGGCAANYLDDDEPRLANTKRRAPLQHFVLHETAGNSATGCKDTLRAKGLGIHLILGKDGVLSNHADLALDECWHANQCNRTSIGIEVVNAYRPEFARKPCGPVLPAQWWTWVAKGHGPTYQAPLGVQVAVLQALVPWLCAQLQIPFVFPTRDLGPKPKRPKIAGWQAPPLGWSAKPGPGVVAHRDFASHADGRYLLEQVMAAAAAPAPAPTE